MTFYWPNQKVGKVKRTCIAPFVKLQLKALRYGSHRVVPANYTMTIPAFKKAKKLKPRYLV